MNWLTQARPEQHPPPGNWSTWLIMAGRGFGKTRTGAETVRLLVDQGQAKHIALIGQNVNEAKHVMIEGQSGLLSCYNNSDLPDDLRPKYQKSRDQIFWSNGAKARFYGGDYYDKLRGPQFDCAWVDELAKFRHPEELWMQLMMTLRLGERPRCIITTTPRPIPLLHQLVADPSIVVTKGSTFDNAPNLSPLFLERAQNMYGDTRIGAQELHGELHEMEEGALWRKSFIRYQKPETTRRIVIAIDPAVTSTGSETGIIVACMDHLGKGYVLDDLSGKHTPHHWGAKAVEAYYQYKADRIVAEVNQGGDMVEKILRTEDRHVPFRAVRATRGKCTRAEPIVALYEQGKIFHTRYFDILERQMLAYKPGDPSPDRMDALVWAMTDLFEMQRTVRITVY